MFKHKKWRFFVVQCFSICEKALLFGRFPGFAPSSFWQKQLVDLEEDELRALVE